MQSGWINEDQFEMIAGLMRKEAERTTKGDLPVVRTHGDSWRDNVLITPNGQAVLFDNALKYGLAANDIAFAIGDRVLAWLTKEDGEAKGMVEAFMRGYGEHTNMGDVFAGLGFKAVVGAAFDEYSDQERGQIVGWIIRTSFITSSE